VIYTNTVGTRGSKNSRKEPPPSNLSLRPTGITKRPIADRNKPAIIKNLCYRVPVLGDSYTIRDDLPRRPQSYTSALSPTIEDVSDEDVPMVTTTVQSKGEQPAGLREKLIKFPEYAKVLHPNLIPIVKYIGYLEIPGITIL
jgi:hypothetical protein